MNEPSRIFVNLFAGGTGWAIGYFIAGKAVVKIDKKLKKRRERLDNE